MKRLEAVVHGRVQGVYFRANTQRKARELALTGWVRNRPDGTVELAAEGSEQALNALHAFLKQGPPAAHVAKVETAWLPATQSFSEFRIRWN